MTAGFSLSALIALALVLAMAVLPPGAASAQPVSQWSAILGGSGDEFAHSVALAGDGGFVIAGETRSYGSGSQDGWLVKLDSNGQQQWSRTFGGAESDTIYSVQAASDGGFVLAGETHSAEGATAGSSHFWLVKTNSLGLEEWQKSYGSTAEPESSKSTGAANSDVAHAVRQTSDGGYILVGSSIGASTSAVRLVRTDSEGTRLWGRSLAAVSGGVGYDVAEIPGGYAVAGSASSEDKGSQAFLMATDASGQTRWTPLLRRELQRRGAVSSNSRKRRLCPRGLHLVGGRRAVRLLDAQGQRFRRPRMGARLWRGAARRRPFHHPDVRRRLCLGGMVGVVPGGGRLWVVKTDSYGKLHWSSSQRSGSNSSGDISAARAPSGRRPMAGS